MTKKERWLYSIGLLFSILPFIIVAASLQLMPHTVEIIVDIMAKVNVVEMSKYNYLFLGLFCLVPFVLIVSARLLKGKGAVGHNFIPMVISGLVIGVVFMIVGTYGVVYQVVTKKVDLLRDIDVIGTIAIVMSVVMGLLSNFLPDLKPNEIIGFKNRYTMSSNKVWEKVHTDMNNVAMGAYFLLAIIISALSIGLNYSYSWIHLCLWVLTTVILVLWSAHHSKAVAAKLKVTVTQSKIKAENSKEVKDQLNYKV